MILKGVCATHLLREVLPRLRVERRHRGALVRSEIVPAPEHARDDVHAAVRPKKLRVDPCAVAPAPLVRAHDDARAEGIQPPLFAAAEDDDAEVASAWESA